MKNVSQNCVHRTRYNLCAYPHIAKRILLTVAAACLLLTQQVFATTNSNAEKPLRFGVMPFLSTTLMVKKFEPLISYLETRLKRPVTMNSAPNFDAFIKNTINGDYDLFLAAPHIAAYMEKNHQSRRVSRFERELKGYFVVHADSTYQSLDELRGKRFATADPLAVITILAEAELVKIGINPDKDITRHFSNHNNAMFLVAEGEQDVAAVGITIYDNIRATIKDRLRVLTETRGIPHMMFQTRRGLPVSEHQAVHDAILNFTASGDGKDFFKKVAFGDMAAITDDDIKTVSNLIPLLEDRISK